MSETITPNFVQVDADVVAVLERSRIEEDRFYLPNEQLDRKLYQAVNAVIESIGGTWDRKAKAHILSGDEDAADRLADIVATGVYDKMRHPKTLNQTIQFFPTPQSVAKRIVAYADIQPHHTVLEPSAGTGSILLEIGRVKRIVAVEKHAPFRDQLSEAVTSPTSVVIDDFLEWAQDDSKQFDRVVMNPPFTRGQDMAHVTAAYNLLAPGGVLVSVMSPHFTFGNSRKAGDFREWFDDMGGEILEELRDGEFKESGTMVNTVIVRMRA